MSDFTGMLSIISNQSSLNNNLLLLTGIPDTAQAMFAATQFLVKTRRLNSGQLITVSGKKVAGVGIIVMHDARAASQQPFGAAILGMTAVADSTGEDSAESVANALSPKTTVKKTRKSSRKTTETGGKKPTKSRRKNDSGEEGK